MEHSTTTSRRRLGPPCLAVGLLLASVALAGCGTTATPNPATASPPAVPAGSVGTPAPSGAATATPPPAATPVAGTGSAEAWCAFVIEINTKYGYMTDKNYSKTPPSIEVQHQILTEALGRVDEWVAKTPPEIKDATAAEVAYFQALKAYGDLHGWTSAAGFPQPTANQATLIGSLVPYQEQKCGITFGK